MSIALRLSGSKGSFLDCAEPPDMAAKNAAVLVSLVPTVAKTLLPKPGTPDGAAGWLVWLADTTGNAGAAGN